ncbi:MAG: ABC transporter substrate-binding protein [Beijerinckiaceae bacterium]
MIRMLLASVALVSLSSLAQAQAVPERIKTAGKIVIATQPNYAPITYKDPSTNKLTGFDIDLGEAIGAELGLKVEWQETAFAQMLPSLQTGRVDMVMAFMSDTPTRRETADFVNYVRSGAQYYTQATRLDIRVWTDLCGKKIGASRSTTWPADIAAWSKENCEAGGLKPVEVIGTEGSVDARAQLKTGRLDAGVQGSETLPYFQNLEPNTYVVVGKAFTDKLVGIPFVKTPEGNQLRDAVKGAIERLQAKGTYAALITKYGMRNNTLEKITINQGT